jgi:hypothetical protein
MKNILIILLLFTCALPLFAGNKKDSTSTKSNQFRYIPQEAFGFGETLNYKVGYKFITAGTGYFKILPKPVKVNGRDAYDIRFEVRSLKELEWIYKVQDKYRTVVDVAGIFPYKFEQHIREGGYKTDFECVFDQVNNKAIIQDTTKHDVPEYVHDIVSALYYVRTLNFDKIKKDSIIELKNFYKDSTYTLGVKYHGKQTIEVEAGKFKTLVVEPMVVEGGLFKSEGKILVWLSDDDRKIPVKVATKIIIGFVGAELTSYKGLRGPLDAKIED